MFEEEFDHCFICQQACKGLYCSPQCRQQDKGSASPSQKANGDIAPVRLTAQLPASLSPMVRPTHAITPSPLFGSRRRGTTSSSSSSLTESPIHSPHTNPSGSESPQKDAFSLPPQAYPLGNVGSVPVKIPTAFQNRVPSSGHNSNAGSNAGTHGASTPTGASVDTLRFGRKSSVTNSVTSPLALAPRCGCGRALGHRNRSRGRGSAGGDADSGAAASAAAKEMACLSIGAGAPGPPNGGLGLESNADVTTLHLASDPIHRTAPRTPSMTCPTLPEERSISHVLGGGASLLSRSRSDPYHPPSPRTVRASRAPSGLHPRPALDVSLGATPPEQTQLPPVAPIKGSGRSRSAAPRAGAGGDDRRGRSRERMPRVAMTPEISRAALQYHEEREVAPSRRSRSRGLVDDSYRLPPGAGTARGRAAGVAS